MKLCVHRTLTNCSLGQFLSWCWLIRVLIAPRVAPTFLLPIVPVIISVVVKQYTSELKQHDVGAIPLWFLQCVLATGLFGDSEASVLLPQRNLLSQATPKEARVWLVRLSVIYKLFAVVTFRIIKLLLFFWLRDTYYYQITHSLRTMPHS